ncbi:MAG TPA: lipase family protein [Acidimicrobiia bacterium]|nr:lipase family protein [Acidimicrobiia bacterium]
MRRLIALLVLPVLVLAACSDDDGGSDEAAATDATTTTVAEVVEAPAGDAFYEPPADLDGYENGDLIWAETLAAPDGVVAWKVLYRSESVAGDPVAVSGVVAAPDAPAPEGGRPVVTWAHGTTGTADECAPSRGGVPLDAVFEYQPVVDAGYVGVATDYEGLGTPELHPYLVGESQGRGVLDIVRAAQQIPETGAGDQVAIWGVSQGGHAALFAASIAPEYAPDLDVVGTVGAAPPGDLTALGAAASIPQLAGFALMVGGGYQAAYGDVNLDQIIGADNMDRLAILEEECTGGVFASTDAEPLALANPVLEVEPWADLLADNSPINQTYDTPLLILQGEDDAIVPKSLTDGLVEGLCTDGVDVEYRTYPDTGHGGEIGQNSTAALDWLTARLAGEPTAPTC